jgi:hypothetical protein
MNSSEVSFSISVCTMAVSLLMSCWITATCTSICGVAQPPPR